MAKTITIIYNTDNQAMIDKLDQQKVIIDGINKLFDNWLDKLSLYDYNWNNVWIITTF